MHGSRPEHPEVFKARMQFHKDRKRESGSAKSEKDEKEEKATKRQMPLTRKHSSHSPKDTPKGGGYGQ